MTPQRKKLTILDKIAIKVVLQQRIEENEKDIKELFEQEEYENIIRIINERNNTFNELIEKLS